MTRETSTHNQRPSASRRLLAASTLVLLVSLASACAGTTVRRSSLGRANAGSRFLSVPEQNIDTNGGARGGEDGEAGEKRNKVALFIGGTHKADVDGASIGIEYERRLSELVGVGLLFETTPSLNERLVGLPGLFLHPVGDLAVLLAPGFENEDGETVFVFRVGVGWDFDLGGGVKLAPEINYDFVDGPDDAVVYGVTVAYEF